jgi:hypothetical protein
VVRWWLVVVVFLCTYVPTYSTTVQYSAVLLYMCCKQEHKADHGHKKRHAPRAQERHLSTGISRPRTEVLRTRAYFCAANTLLRSRASRGHLNLYVNQKDFLRQVQSGTLLHALRVQLKRRVSARRGGDYNEVPQAIQKKIFWLLLLSRFSLSRSVRSLLFSLSRCLGRCLRLAARSFLATVDSKTDIVAAHCWILSPRLSSLHQTVLLEAPLNYKR